MPSWPATRASAPGRVAGSRRASTAIRVARSRSSSGYFLGAAMTLILPLDESLHQTRRGTVDAAAGWSLLARFRYEEGAGWFARPASPRPARGRLDHGTPGS